VNLANAYKLDGKVEKAMATLDGEDWGIVSDNFAISVAAVKDDVDTVIIYMRRLAQSGDWNGTFLEQWPVFFNIREREKFLSEFETLFGRKFVPVPKNRHKVLTSFFEQAQPKRNNGPSLSKRRKRNLTLDADKESKFSGTDVKSSQHRD
jgi:hypothetical protein